MESDTLIAVGEKQLRQACNELDRRLRAGEPCSAEELLAQFPRLADQPDLAIEVIYTEFALREELGQQPAPEIWYARFPRWRERLQRLFQVHVQFEEEAQRLPASLTSPTMGRDGGPVLPPARPEVMLGDYEILSEIGRGGMGVVYKARQVKLNRLVAVKMILVGAHAGTQELARFRAEAETLARMQHPNVVQIYEVAEEGGRPYFVLEYVDGGNLEAKLAGKPWPVRDSARLIETLARAIEAAHQRGIVHCDLKPANILLAGGATTSTAPHEPITDPQPKITDFGLARRLEEHASLTNTGAVMGTPNYMAPEQAAGRRKEVSPATDVYALGAILYEVLTGRPPFQAATPLDTLEQVRHQEPVAPTGLQPKTPRDLETICLKCLEKDPRKRYARAEQLADDLRRFLVGEPIRAYRISPLGRSWRWCRRQPVLAGLSASLVIVVLGAFAGMASLWWLAEQRSQEAQRRHNEADRHYQQARRAVDEFTSRLSERRMLETPGSQPLRKELLETALRYYEGFLASGRNDPTLQADVARTYNRIGNITSLIGSRATALASFKQACDLQERLVREQPDDLNAQYELGGYLTLMGFSLGTVGRFPEALNCFRRTDEMCARLATLDVSPLRAHRLQAQNKHNQALCERRLGRIAEALRSFQDARDLRAELLAAEPASLRGQWDMGWSLLNIGNVQQGLGKLDEVKQSFQEALVYFTRLAEQDPANPQYRYTHVKALGHMGDYATLVEDYETALQTLTKGHRICAELVRENPMMSDYVEAMGENTMFLGTLYRRHFNADEALLYHWSSHDCFRRLVEVNPEDPGYRTQFGRALHHLCFTYELLDQRELALDMLERAFLQYEAALQQAPDSKWHRDRLRWAYDSLSVLYVQLGRHHENRALAYEMIRRWPHDPNDLYDAACFLGRNVPLVARLETRPATEGPTLARTTAQEALLLLQQAVAAGYRNPGKMRRDPDLASLQQEPAFEVLVRGLELLDPVKPKKP